MNTKIKTREVFLIRHAESIANEGRRTTDPASIVLTKKGFEQSAYLANSFKHKPELIVTSSYLRTKQTAKPFFKRFGNVKKMELSVQEFTYLALDRCKNTTTQERRPLVAEYWERNDPLFVDGIGAESFVDFMKRVNHFIGQLRSLENECTTVFSHGQFIRGVIWRLLTGKTNISSFEMKQFRSFLNSFKVSNAAIVKLKVEKDDSLWVCELF